MLFVSSAAAPNLKLEEQISEAQHALQQGELARAISLFRSALVIDPEHLLANYWIGVLALKVGAPHEALAHLEWAALKDPEFPDFQLDLGLVYQALGKLERAEACFERVRQVSPVYAAAQLRLAEDFEKQAQPLEAIELCQRGLLAFPRDAGLLQKLADLLVRLNRWPEALATWRKLLEVRPNCPATFYAFGLTCFQAKDIELAGEAFQRALELQPTLLPALLNLGLVRQKSGKFQDAREYFQRALAISSNDPEIYKALGDVHRDLGEWGQANAAWEKAVALRPEYADAWQNLGLSLERENRLDEALACHRHVVELRPKDVTALRYLGMVCQDMGMLEEAEGTYRQALRWDPNDAEVHWQIFAVLACKGQFPQAWEEHEWRWENKNRTTPKRSFRQPRWDGDDLAGRSILLYSEQGFGDSIQAVRYIPLVKARGGRVLLWCPPELVTLFQTVPGVVEVFSSLGPGARFDTHLPLMSLPLIFGTTVATIPNDVPYLRRSREQPLTSLGESRNWPKVGLVWCGSQSQPNDRRPIPFECLRPLLAMSGIEFYSLQIGSMSAEIKDAASLGAIIDLSAQLNDFSDTAAAMEQLDLVITVDTSVAHLAGALGRPVWVLLSFAPDWRWMLEREDSPWYPTMRLFRQVKPGDWGEVMVRVRAALEERLVHHWQPASWKPWLAEALVHHQAGRMAEAEQLYQRILKRQPEQADTLRLFGVLNRQRGKLEEARTWLEKALVVQPQSAESHHDLGLAFFEMGRLEKAISAYQQAIQIQPEFSDAHYNLGNAYYALKRWKEAEASYRRAVEQQPDLAQAHYNLGLLAQEARQPEAAISSYEQAIRFDPTHLDALLNLGIALKDAGRMEESESCLQRVLTLNPAHVKARVNLATIFAIRARQSTAQQDLDRAEALCQEALQIDSDLPEAWSNLGVIRQAKGAVDEAIACCERALKSRPEDAETRFNLAIGQLLSGQFEPGWHNYEARWKTPNPIFADRGFSQPLWKGEDLAGRTLLVHAEQGHGDTIQFVRYLPLLAQRGARVILECQPALKPLLTTVEGVSNIIERGEPTPACDYQIPLMSLPLQMRTSIETIPDRVPYLRVPDGIKLDLHSPPSTRLRMGLVWAGSPHHSSDRIRSLQLLNLAPIWSLSGIAVYSLQIGTPRQQLVEVEGANGIIDLSSQLTDFAVTASAIQQLDLVVTVDTAVAHLSGALNKPAWVLLPFAPDWRWLLDRKDSPWYPGMRLFRQPRPGDWAAVIDAVAIALAKEVA